MSYATTLTSRVDVQNVVGIDVVVMAPHTEIRFDIDILFTGLSFRVILMLKA